MEEQDYLKKNRASWNKRTNVHISSDFYDVASFIAGRNSLHAIELKLLGNVGGKSILHLQCHFGQDTLSLARMGALVTGVDLSDNAIQHAEVLAIKTGLKGDFICCDVYSLPQFLHRQFDIVFTSYGTIGWLPDIDKWAKIVSQFLKPEGKFVFADFHPVLWMFDTKMEHIVHNYFNAGPILENENGTYTDRHAAISGETVGWNHPTSEVLTGLLSNGLRLDVFEEFDYSPYNCFENMVEFEPGKFRFKHLENKLPLMFSLMATKI
ncbi:MAG: class I SAM-dependent methyltransferase [bacterium]|nr:class I SAM-dependent methyltransferase [bacterium]